MFFGERTMHTELGTINEGSGIDRKLSCSPEPIDPRALGESAQTSGPATYSQGFTLPTSKAGTCGNISDAVEFDVGVPRQDSGSSYRAFIQASGGHSSRRNAGETASIYQEPQRQFTKVTNASLSFEETEAWDKKAILALGTNLS